MTQNVSVTRNLSKVDEMGMSTEKYTLRAEVDHSDGNVRSINNGSVISIENGMYVCGFVARSQSTLNVTFQNTDSAEERRAIYEAIEDFLGQTYASVSETYAETLSV